ncbi:MAG: DUF1805 domain-containing protein [Candidatus Altiarchaeales archaeon]|nr:MAG: DUF1805 domain-containing protein [Candidatus Altiarchaeales archaeon]
MKIIMKLIKLMKMIEPNKIVEVRGIKGIDSAAGVTVRLPNKNLVLIIGKKGFIMCGYLDIETAERFDDVACIVTDVSTVDDILNAKIKAVTSNARSLGIREGMSGREALKIIS